MRIVLLLGIFIACAPPPSAFIKNAAAADLDNYPAKVYGIIESLPETGKKAGIWLVNDREILVNEQTRIDEEFGSVEKGAYVEVEGNYTDKTFTAYKIEVRMNKQ